MKKEKSTLKRFSLNSLGVILIGIGLVFGPLPITPGTPVVLAGLSLLAANNPKIAKFQKKILSQHADLTSFFFPDNGWISLAWDLISLALLASSLKILFWMEIDSGVMFWKIVGSGMFTGGFFFLMSNRQRSIRLANWWRNRKKKDGTQE